MPKKNAEASTTPKQPFLMEKNAPQLWAFIGVNLAVFFALFATGGPSAGEVDQFWNRVTAKDGIILAVIPILAIVFNGVFSDTWKARLVFWKWSHPLPGCRVFSELLASDDRINKEALSAKLGPYPQEPDKQNALWFDLYKNRHGGVEKVLKAHRIYLLTRDMTSIAVLFVILLPAGFFAANIDGKVALIYAAVLLAQCFLIAVSARNYGNRFVLNVLVEESQS